MVPASKKVIQIHAADVQIGTTSVGSGATNYIDTKGYDYAFVDVAMSTSDAATNNPSELNLYEADVTTSSSFATVSGCVGDTDFDIGTADTSNWHVYRFAVDTRGRKRYLKATCLPLTTQDILVTADLFRAEEAPITATKAGVSNLVAV